MLYSDLALARRIETAQAAGLASYGETHARLFPEVGGASISVAGGCALYAGPGSPMTQAAGLGVGMPIASEEIDRLDAFYAERGVAYELQLSPFVDPTVFEHIAARRFRILEFETVWVLELGGTWISPSAPGVAVSEVTATERDLWARTAGGGFAPEDVEGAVAIVLPMAHSPEVRTFLARVDGEPAGGAALVVREGLAQLFTASTAPALRRRGVQTALLGARLAAAVEAGCDLATVATKPDTPSARNVERAGFRVAYTRITFVRSWE